MQLQLNQLHFRIWQDIADRWIRCQSEFRTDKSHLTRHMLNIASTQCKSFFWGAFKGPQQLLNMAACHEFFMGFPIIQFFRGVMPFPLRETCLCPAWLTRIEIPQLQLSGKKTKAGWRTSRTPPGEGEQALLEPYPTFRWEEGSRGCRTRVYRGKSWGRLEDWGLFNYSTHSEPLYQTPDAFCVLLRWIVQWWNKEGVYEWPRCDRDSIGRRRMVSSWGQGRVMRIESQFFNMPSRTFKY